MRDVSVLGHICDGLEDFQDYADRQCTHEGDGSPLPPVKPTISSTRSRHWSKLDPAWLAQERLGRGVQDIGSGWQPIPGRVLRMTRAANGWFIECHLGPAPARRLGTRVYGEAA